MLARSDLEAGFILRLLARCAAFASLAALPPTALATGRAYVISGNDSVASETAANDAAADSAQANYVRQGYTVVRLNQPTRAQIIAAFQDPLARAVWFVGHGGKNNGAYVPFIAHNTKAGAAGEVGIRPTDLAGALGHLQQVVLHGCGQFLQGWINRFPNASVVAWTGAVSSWSIRFDEYWRGQGRIPARNPFGPPMSDIPILVDPRLDAAITFSPFDQEPGIDIDYLRSEYATYGFTMPTALASLIGTKTFNVVVRDPNNPVDFQLLGGLEVGGGAVVGQNNSGYSLPDFVYELDPLTYCSALENCDSIRTAFDTGVGRIVDNTTGLPDRKLFSAASYVMWKVPGPGTVAVAASAGLFVLRRRR